MQAQHVMVSSDSDRGGLLVMFRVKYSRSVQKVAVRIETTVTALWNQALHIISFWELIPPCSTVIPQCQNQ